MEVKSIRIGKRWILYPFSLFIPFQSFFDGTPYTSWYHVFVHRRLNKLTRSPTILHWVGPVCALQHKLMGCNTSHTSNSSIWRANHWSSHIKNAGHLLDNLTFPMVILTILWDSDLPVKSFTKKGGSPKWRIELHPLRSDFWSIPMWLIPGFIDDKQTKT
jgi:hypothetical protein